jgi:hypothetical protein
MDICELALADFESKGCDDIRRNLQPIVSRAALYAFEKQVTLWKASELFDVPLRKLKTYYNKYYPDKRRSV